VASTPELTAAQEHIERLEHSQRRLQLQVVGLFVLVLGFAVLNLTRSRAVTASSFVLENNGQVRAALSAGADGSPGLILSDGAGRMRAALQVTAEGVPALMFGDDSGHVRAVIGVPSDGVPSLVLLADSGKVRYVTP
jgi:hypothetical protein